MKQWMNRGGWVHVARTNRNTFPKLKVDTKPPYWMIELFETQKKLWSCSGFDFPFPIGGCSFHFQVARNVARFEGLFSKGWTESRMNNWDGESKIYTPENWHVPKKRDYFNRKYIFQPSFFRGYVSFQGCTGRCNGWFNGLLTTYGCSLLPVHKHHNPFFPIRL